jgi:NADPH-dependent curcumin reductase CurA
MRNWLNAARSYMRPIEIGESMRAAGIGRVVDSKSKNIAVGDLVSRVLSYGLETMRRTLRDRSMGLLIGRNIGLGVMIK